MSTTCTPAGGCGTQIDLNELLTGALVKETATGCVYLKINLKLTADCNDFEPVQSCGSQMKIEEIIKQAITVDSCNRPVLNILYETV